MRLIDDTDVVVYLLQVIKFSINWIILWQSVRRNRFSKCARNGKCRRVCLYRCHWSSRDTKNHIVWRHRRLPRHFREEERVSCRDGDIHKVLTFEDRPSKTPEILDILAQYDVKATFCGQEKRRDRESQALPQRKSQMRTYARHALLIPTRISQMGHLKKIFERLRDGLSVTGVNGIYYRFPGGSSNPDR